MKMRGLKRQISSRQNSTELIGDYLPFHLINLTPEIIQKAETELGETPEKREKCLKELKRLITAEKDLKPLMDDEFLLRFLRARKFATEAAFRTLKNYYAFKACYSGILTDILPSELEHVSVLSMATNLPYRDRDGSSIIVGRIGNFDYSQTTMTELFSAVLIGIEYVLKYEASQICGVVIVLDLKGVGLRLVRRIASPGFIYQAVKAAEDCVPVRIKAVHVINEPFYVSIVYNIIKKFLSDKLKKRVQFHGSERKSLFSQVPAQFFPEEFGGKQGPMDGKKIEKEILGLEDYYAEMRQYGYKEEMEKFSQRRGSLPFEFSI